MNSESRTIFSVLRATHVTIIYKNLTQLNTVFDHLAMESMAEKNSAARVPCQSNSAVNCHANRFILAFLQ